LDPTPVINQPPPPGNNAGPPNNPINQLPPNNPISPPASNEAPLDNPINKLPPNSPEFPPATTATSPSNSINHVPPNNPINQLPPNDPEYATPTNNPVSPTNQPSEKGPIPSKDSKAPNNPGISKYPPSNLVGPGPSLVNNNQLTTDAPTYLIGHSTIIPGQINTISGLAMSLQPDGFRIVVESKTLAMSSFLAAVGSDSSIVSGDKTVALPPNSVLRDDPAALMSVFSGNAASVLVGSKTLALSDPSISVVADATTIPLSEFMSGLTPAVSGTELRGTSEAFGTSGASVVIGSQTLPLSSFVAGILPTSSAVEVQSTAATNGLVSIIASMAGYKGSQTPTSTGNGQVGGFSNNNGPMPTGKSSAVRLQGDTQATALVQIGRIILINIALAVITHIF
jgi:hypothetical protein